MFYELAAKSHIQIPCHLFTGGIIKNDKDDNKNKEQKDDEDKNKENKPEISNGNLVEEVMKHLWEEYCNKIMPPDHGLCITVSAIDKIGDAQIFMEDGSTYVDVEFRLIMFKPYNNEIIEGEIATSDDSGIRISLGFFEQVFIPYYNFPDNCKYDKSEQCWVWQIKSGDKLIFETGEDVRLKVVTTKFKPQDNDKSIDININKNDDGEKKNDDEDEDIDIQNNNKDSELLETRLLKQPMIVYGSFKEQGLGLPEWWD